MESQYLKYRSYGTNGKMSIAPPQQSDNDRSSSELRALDCNLTSLCDHIQTEVLNSGLFSDIVVHAMGSTYHLHRLFLSRSSYFRVVQCPGGDTVNTPYLTSKWAQQLRLNSSQVEMPRAVLCPEEILSRHPMLCRNGPNNLRLYSSQVEMPRVVQCPEEILSIHPILRQNGPSNLDLTPVEVEMPRVVQCPEEILSRHPILRRNGPNNLRLNSSRSRDAKMGSTDEAMEGSTDMEIDVSESRLSYTVSYDDVEGEDETIVYDASF